MPNPPKGDSAAAEIQHNGVVVIVGANGSGKSRLGFRFEENRSAQALWHTNAEMGGPREDVRRISAHRALNFYSDGIPRLPREQAQRQLHSGQDYPSGRSRVPGDPVIGLMNDFPYVVQALFAERDAQALAYLRESFDEERILQRPQKTLLDQVKALWEKVFPQRQLIIEDYAIHVVATAGTTSYPGGQLSDGERVGFYLIGHTLLAPPGITLIIDEPELHLHESIQSALWNALELERPDCNFVYITHDLEFAASRVGAPKIVLHDFQINAEGPRWEWELAPGGTSLPEDVLLRIIGSRRPTLFVEGTTGSLDHKIYEAAYPEYYVVPAGSCDEVIRAVKVFCAHAGLHRFKVFGLIDRDDRQEDEIQELAAIGIGVLPYAQVENILVAEEVMEAFSSHMRHEPGERSRRIADAKCLILDLLQEQREETIAKRAQYMVERRLSGLTPAGPNADQLAAAVDTAVRNADPHGAFRAAEAEVDGALASSSYEDALALLRNKGVVARAARAMPASVEDYRRVVVALLGEDAALRERMARVLPHLGSI